MLASGPQDSGSMNDFEARPPPANYITGKGCAPLFNDSAFRDNSGSRCVIASCRGGATAAAATATNSNGSCGVIAARGEFGGSGVERLGTASAGLGCDFVRMGDFACRESHQFSIL